MFIYWGKKHVVRKLGYAADFCPICRTLNKFRISRVGLASHVYGVSVGGGKLVGHQKTCLECGVASSTHPSLYKDIQKKRPDQSETRFTLATFPNVREHYSERLLLEERLTAKPASLDAQTRASLIKEPFHILAPAVEKRFAATHIDRHVGIALLMTLVGTVVAADLLPIVFPSALAHRDEVVLAVLAIGIFVTAVQGYQSAARYLRREIYPKLARALRSLQPSQGEIDAVFAELRGMGFKLPKKARMKDLLEEIAGDPATGRRPQNQPMRNNNALR